MLHRFLSMMALFCCSPHAFSFPSDSFAPLPPTRNETANPLHWEELSEAESVTFFAPGNQILSQDHPVRLRLQSWSDALYAQLEKRWPARFRDSSGKVVLPRPIVRVERSVKPEAHVSAATVCYAAKIKFASDTGQDNGKGSGIPQVLLLNDKGTVGVFEKSKVSCIDRLDRAFRVDDLRELIGSVRCDVHVEEQADDGSLGQTLVIGSDCKIPASATATDIQGIMLRSMAQEVTITTGLLAIMPNEGALIY
ncbi:MAG: hypothetical protein FJ146_18195, partial [Deltaproteobacteria bacterium]|nr:hypothetical protein [Deltaproteobacteria bacterium]